MAACVETMMYVRETPWHGLGTRVEEAPTSDDALRLGGLDWRVKQNDVIVNGVVVPNYKANVRDSDNSVLGIVTDRYQIVQNTDAFAFTDSLLDNDGVRYETCGSLRNGKTIWLLARLPETKILGDDFEQYLCFSNNHDGTGAVRAFMTDVRVVCNNTLNLALSTAKRSWSVRHTGDITSKLEEAKVSLELANKYTENLAIEADVLANTKVSDDQIMEWVNELFPMTDKMTERAQCNIIYCRNHLLRCYEAEDIKQYRNTAWGFVNATSDFVGHVPPTRNAKNYWENNWGKIMNGHPVLDKAYDLVRKVA